MVEALIGHTDGLNASYRRYSPTQIAEMYQKGEPELLLNVSAQNQIKIKTEMGEQKQELSDLSRMMTKLMFEKDELRSKVESLEISIRAYNKIFEDTPELREYIAKMKPSARGKEKNDLRSKIA